MLKKIISLLILFSFVTAIFAGSAFAEEQYKKFEEKEAQYCEKVGLKEWNKVYNENTKKYDFTCVDDGVDGGSGF